MKNICSEILPALVNALMSMQEFIKKFREISNVKNDIFVSFDVNELYPSVDTMEIANVVNEKLMQENTLQELYPMIKEQLMCLKKKP